MSLGCSDRIPELEGQSRGRAVSMPAGDVDSDMEARAAAYWAEVGPPLEAIDVAVATPPLRAAPPAERTLPLGQLEGPTGFSETVAMAGDLLALASPHSAAKLRLLRRAAHEWIEEARFDPFVPAVPQHWLSLAITADRLAIGLPSQAAAFSPGAVRTYERAGSTWVAGPTLPEPDSVFGGHFGFSVALDGDTLAVGAPFAEPGGTVQLYRRTAGGWDLASEVRGARPGDRFGASLAIGGNTLVVGAPGDDGPPRGDGSPSAWGAGAVLIFERSAAGEWSPAARLVIPALPPRGAPACHGMGCVSAPRAVEELGASVALDGDVLIAGAPGAGDPRMPSGHDLAV